MVLKFLKRQRLRKRKDLLKALGKDRYFICMASDVYRPPVNRHSFGKWAYLPGYSSQEQALYKKKNVYVISFRGTAKMHDNTTNIKLIMGKFFVSSRFKRDLTFVQTFQGEHPGAKIILAGHSLGGRLASEIGKKLGIEAVTFNEARVSSDIEKADNHEQIRRYRTASDSISAFGVVGRTALRTKFIKIPGHGHSIKKLARLICRGNPVWYVVGQQIP
jgi:hypothetical protein